MNHNLTKLTKESLLIRNTLFSLMGLTLPLVIAFFSIPILVVNLGLDRFGALTLAWVVTGYFGLFDLGIGRALTKILSEKLGAELTNEIPTLVWSAFFLVFGVGVLGGLLIGVASPYLVSEVLEVSPELKSELIHALYVLAISTPIVITAACLRGVLESYQRFDLINMIRIPVGALIFLSPLFIVPFSNSLFYIVIVLVAVRFIECLVNLALCFFIIPDLRRSVIVNWTLMKSLIRFGSWMTLSNIVGPLMNYLDRFIISSVISMQFVAYYTTPYEMISKLMFIPGAFVGVLFPAFGASFVNDRALTVNLYCKGLKYTSFAMFPLVLIIITFSYEGLSLWLGEEFSKNSARILQWLAVGAFINSLSYIPYGLLHAGGRPDLTAKLHLIESPFYLVVIWYLISNYGIEGAAMAWVLRVTFDTLILFGLTQLLISIKKTLILRFILSIVVALLCFFIFTALPSNIVLKGFFLFLTLIGSFLIFWLIILKAEERQFMRNYLKI